ncbi:type VI secretion system Vgr family protein [Uliginosibacterium paludis]|uniref:Type VI secretion system Vgr family protein n=1 Tax=Uliginosibacterium paludis TaxID=1615952 RepID=A0ABV2CRV0_9RHOO
MNQAAAGMLASQALSALAGLRSDTRLYDMSIEGLSRVEAPLEFEAFAGTEALSTLYRHEVLLLSTQASLSLESLLGRQMRFTVRLADGSAHARSGYIAQARRLGADGALTRYQVSLVPWLWLLTQRTDCRVFQDKTVLEIVETVFAAYAPRAAWQLAEGVERFLSEAPHEGKRSYCVQYRESDYAFISRLMAEEGLGYCFIPADAEEPGQAPLHQLLIFSQNDALPEDPSSASASGGTGIRFHRAASQEAQDAITALGARRVLQAAVITTLSWDYSQKRNVVTSLPTSQQFGSANAPHIEDYDAPGAGAFANEAAARHALRIAREAIEARNKVFAGTSSVRSFTAGARFVLANSPLDLESRLRGETGAADSAANSRHFLLTEVRHAGINNLPRDLDDTARVLEQLIQTAENGNTTDTAPLVRQARSRGYANHFAAQRVYVPWRPALIDDTGIRINPRPTALGPQTAIVVGANGETHPGADGEIHTDALHRIRVQFHWQAANPERNEACSMSSAWLRVASRYAGKGLGAQFVPRIGQAVLVGFLENDIDRPIVLGSLYDGAGEDGVAATPGGLDSTQTSARSPESSFSNAKDHAPAHQGNRIAGGHSPAWHGEASAYGPMRNRAALSGFKSAEFNQPHAGYNQLVFDDTDGQQRIQLATTQATTQLNLGHIIHQADNYRGSHRGDGFELRSDAYGALRAGRGLMLTTWPLKASINQASSEPAGDATAPTALLKQASELFKNTSQIAATHKTVKVAASEGATSSGKSTLKPDLAPLPAMLKSAKGMVSTDLQHAAPSTQPAAGGGSAVPHSEDPLLTLAARGGMGFVSGQSLQWASGETLNWASGQDSNFALATSLRIHTGQSLGILSSAQGKGHLKAIAATGPVIAQAQADTMTLASKEQLKMISVSGKLDMASAKKIHLAVAGGSAITIEGGNITVQSPGMLTVHASQRSFVGPGKVEAVLPQFPNSSICIECLKKAMESGSPLAALT